MALYGRNYCLEFLELFTEKIEKKNTIKIIFLLYSKSYIYIYIIFFEEENDYCLFTDFIVFKNNRAILGDDQNIPEDFLSLSLVVPLKTCRLRIEPFFNQTHDKSGHISHFDVMILHYNSFFHLFITKKKKMNNFMFYLFPLKAACVCVFIFVSYFLCADKKL